MNVSRRDQTVTVELSPGTRVSVSWNEIVEVARTHE